MLGAIVGDIVGSVYEWDNIKTKNFPLFREDCFFTDDTVMTCAVAEAIMNGGQKDDFIDAMKKYGRMYPDAGYGARFGNWIDGDDREPYNSFGNGSAMRVSPCAWAMDCSFCARTGAWPSRRALARLSAEVTHNHPEGVKGAMATSDAIFMCRYYFGGYSGDYGKPINDHPTECKRLIKEHIEQEYGYNLSQTLDEIRPTYRFNETCQDTVPQAIVAFLESTDFEDAIRNAISLGGDSDTLAAITGSIAEAAYGIPDWIKKKAYTYLDEPLNDVLKRWRKHMINNIEVFFEINPDTPRSTKNEERNYNWNKRIKKAHEQSKIAPIQYSQVLAYVNEFLICLEAEDSGVSKKEKQNSIILDGREQTIINNGIIAKECKWTVPVWDKTVKKYSVWENKYSKIKEKFGLSHTKNIIWLKFTQKGYLGVVAKGMDINFFNDNTSGKLVNAVNDKWDESFVLIFPLTDSILYKRDTGEIERAIGNYLISKGVPIIDFYSHNY